MPFLSKNWSLAETVAWVATRDPSSMHGASMQFATLQGYTRLHHRKLEGALECVLKAMSVGKLNVCARNVGNGEVAIIPPDTMADLEFHIATDIPSQPYGFRNVGDHFFEWVEPTIPANQAISRWPRLVSRIRPGT
jgi:hypothetical protein